MTIKSKISFLLLFACFVYSNTAKAQYQSLFEPDVPNIIHISMSGKKMAKYHQSISDIYHDPDMFITNKHKQWFKIYIKNPHNVGMFSAKAKIAGNWKDHIVVGKTTSRAGLKIRMKNGSLGGISNFRLLLPQTRQGMQEIFWSALMESLGFPTLFTKLVIVNLNGVPYYALFQEVPEKEFIERFSFRESPIIEADDRQRMYDRLYRSKLGDFEGRDPRNHRAKIDNKSFLKNPISNKITMEGIHMFLAEETNPQAENAAFFNTINNTYASHGMIWFNEKYIFDPIYNRLVPIYWDGNVSLKDADSPCKIKEKLADEAKKLTSNPAHLAFSKKVSKLYQKRNGAALSDLEKCVIHDILLQRDLHSIWLNEMPLEKRRLEIIERKKPDNIQINIPVDEIDMVYMNKGAFEQCTYKTKPWNLTSCTTLSYQQIGNLLKATEKPVTRKNYDTYRIPYGIINTADAPNTRHMTLTGNSSPPSIQVQKNETLFLDIQASKKPKKIHIHRKDAASSRVVISGVLGAKDKIKISGTHMENSIENLQGSRYDQDLLTGCVTFIDAVLAGGSIHIEKSSCEDAINIIRSKGFVDNIVIRDAMQDGLDVDYSNLHIKQLTVNTAGNDCADFSAGNYIIDHAVLESCKDRAVSIGEASKASLKKVAVNNAHEGIVSKDYSEVHIHDFSGKKISKHCLTSYQKKQEFGPALITIKQKKCVGKDYTDVKSRIVYE